MHIVNDMRMRKALICKHKTIGMMTALYYKAMRVCMCVLSSGGVFYLNARCADDALDPCDHYATASDLLT